MPKQWAGGIAVGPSLKSKSKLGITQHPQLLAWGPRGVSAHRTRLPVTALPSASPGVFLQEKPWLRGLVQGGSCGWSSVSVTLAVEIRIFSHCPSWWQILTNAAAGSFENLIWSRFPESQHRAPSRHACIFSLQERQPAVYCLISVG